MPVLPGHYLWAVKGYLAISLYCLGLRSAGEEVVDVYAIDSPISGLSGLMVGTIVPLLSS